LSEILGIAKHCWPKNAVEAPMLVQRSSCRVHLLTMLFRKKDDVRPPTTITSRLELKLGIVFIAV